MLATIVIVGLGLIWLGYETKWLTIRLEVGNSRKVLDSVPLLSQSHPILALPSPPPITLLAAPRKPKFERMICYNHKAVKA